MYLRSRNFYKSGRVTNTVSQKLSEESVTNMVPILRPIVEKESLSDSLSSMASKTQAFASILEAHSMVLNVRLVFARKNIHNAQLFKDPINHWED